MGVKIVIYRLNKQTKKPKKKKFIFPFSTYTFPIFERVYLILEIWNEKTRTQIPEVNAIETTSF